MDFTSNQGQNLIHTEDISESELSRAGLLAPEATRVAPRPAVRPVLPAYPGPPETPGLPTFLVTLGSKLMIVMTLAWGLAFNFSEVRGSSMEPGIHDQDRILVDQVSYMFGEVSRGDVVVLQYPLDPNLDYIKRVVGLPGDEVVIAQGQVFINGIELAEPYVAKASIEPWTALSTTVRPGHYFVLGDNRRRSSDSREFGQVAAEFLRGKARLRLWPMERAGLIQ